MRAPSGQGTYWTVTARECPDLCFFANKKTWNILNSASCIVGSAHGRQDDYATGETGQSCDECMEFGVDLAWVLDSEWPTVLERFLDHYEKNHKLEMAA